MNNISNTDFEIPFMKSTGYALLICLKESIEIHEDIKNRC